MRIKVPNTVIELKSFPKSQWEKHCCTFYLLRYNLLLYLCSTSQFFINSLYNYLLFRITSGAFLNTSILALMKKKKKSKKVVIYVRHFKER